MFPLDDGRATCQRTIPLPGCRLQPYGSNFFLTTPLPAQESESLTSTPTVYFLTYPRRSGPLSFSTDGSAISRLKSTSSQTTNAPSFSPTAPFGPSQHGLLMLSRPTTTLPGTTSRVGAQQDLPSMQKSRLSKRLYSGRSHVVSMTPSSLSITNQCSPPSWT